MSSPLPHALPQVNKKNSSDFDGVYVYQDLEVPQTAQVKALEDLLKGGPSLGAVGGGAVSDNSVPSSPLWVFM